jgi:formylglycine-generating enzyme required for sulfatase activity
MEFCRIPAEKFLMGSVDIDEDAGDDEGPQHFVDIPYDYWLARFTVTNEQYNAFVQVNGSKHPIASWEKKPDHPVVSVSWKDAQASVKWLNESLSSPQKGLIYRLPTEAEWEKAAHGAFGNIYPWGNEFDQKCCNSLESHNMDTRPVGALLNGISLCGCEQMVGNVWERTHSLIKSYPYNAQE